MGFLDDIFNSIGENYSAGNDFKCTLFANAGYFENITEIVSYGEKEIILRVKAGRITVSGERLYIKKYCGGDVAVCGGITALKREQI